ncbi:BTB/POZ domain and ankyrin repeat-containing protein NPR1 [Camellia lanceoleosa]|uniref:BTB/POZ domain and ankyrin repeat-containing protein NPR1 n=1 Tax=Camellia lanceoleosa TaxID=1840588 RepID=A0ACC0FC06_9ERIC|nr:BTB/POZ domain and ankyrin repeat-containing protein NPR1 [Camellia lanceoleosa]
MCFSPLSTSNSSEITADETLNPNSISENEEFVVKLKSLDVFEQEQGLIALRKLTRMKEEARRHLLDILEKVAADDVLVVLSLANICGKACEKLLTRCIENITRSDVDIITLEKTLPQPIAKQIVDSRKELGLHGPESSGFPDKHVKRILRFGL